MLRSIPFTLVLLCAASLWADDWTDYRGPKRDGSSAEKNLPTSWTPNGEGMAWKAPYGGRSAPVIHGNRLYLFTPVGKGTEMQERIVCLNADTGQLIWEHRLNVYLSDVPPHRVAWSSPVVDPETGNIYVYGVGGYLVALNRAGKQVWFRSMVEEQGLVTTHGGRTVSPVIFENLVIVSGVSTGWGEHARAAHRFFALDKRTGQFIWISTPGGRPFDTTYSPPTIADVNGMKMLIAGGGDGTMHAVKVRTGEPVWKFEMSKRGVNTGAVVLGNQVVVSHSEENLDTSEMGLLASINGAGSGALSAKDVKWKIPGFQGGYSSPIMDGDRVFQLDNGANLFAFDFHTGKQLWKQNLGTIQKASPVWADGKIYVGTENGKFFILKPHSEKCEILDSDEIGSAGSEQILASAAVARGRVYFVSTENIYAIGKKGVLPAAPQPYKPEPAPLLTSENAVGYLQVTPAEIILKPGEMVRLQSKLFDKKGQFIENVNAAEYKLEGLKGSLSQVGAFIPDPANVAQAGLIRVSSAGVSNTVRVRVIPPLPWSEDFEQIAAGQVPRHWLNTTGKFVVREVEGKKVLVKLADNAFTKRARVYTGPSNMSGYVVEVDVNASEKRRQMGDGGVVAQRYQLSLFGNHQRLELQSWQPETERTVLTEFPWKKDTWYRLKLMVENLPDGRVRARGKAWPVGELEPEKWTLEKIDAKGNKEGAPGLYADAPFEVYFDNYKVTPLQGTARAAAAPAKKAAESKN